MTASLVSPLQTVGQQKPAKLRALYGYGVWGFATALLLLAASLKGYELSTRPSVVGYQEHRNWLIMQVQAEGLLGLWMVLGPARRWAWYVVTLGFACFVGVTSYEIMTGATNCGCFGLVHVNPWITLLVDAATVIGLWVTRSMWLTRLPKDTITLSRWLPLIALGISLGVLGERKMVSFAAKPLATDDVVTADGLIVLEPEKWVGKPLPVSRYIDAGPQIERGRWIVIIYHADCAVCRKAVPNFARLATSLREQNRETRVALVEMPPYAEPDESLIPASTDALCGRLSDSREWFAVTPVMLMVTDGVVTSAMEGDKALQASVVLQASEDSPKKAMEGNI